MVSKRKSITDNEAGPSKKKVRSEEKSDAEDSSPQSKKKVAKKTNVVKEEEKDSVDSDEKVINVKKEITDFNISNADKSETQNSNLDLPPWPIEHMSELLRKLEAVLPTRETLTYKSRIERINWDEIAFANYSGGECRIMWDAIQKRVRRYRILRELVEDAKGWISKPWTNFYRGPKTNRHPDLPRRPLSTYMLFYMKKKDKILQENPGFDMTTLSKHMAELYKKLSARSKIKYKDLAAAQRREYEEKMKEFARLHPELARSTQKKEKSVLASMYYNAPTKPLTPFKLFCEDMLKRVEHEVDFDKTSFIENCKEQWRTMSDKKKVFWINWSLDKEAKYQEEIKKYIAENPDYVPAAYKSVVTKEERAIKERMAGKPEKPPNSAYSLFSRLMLVSEDIKSVTPKDRMLLIAQQWKNCSAIEKKDYGDRVKHMLEQYKLQYAEYLESLPEDKRQEELLNSQPKRKKATTPKQKPISKPDRAPNKQTRKSNKITKKQAEKIQKKPVKKDANLFEGEPEPPPATPYLLFMKSYQSSYPNRNDAQEVWENMTDDQRALHRRTLWDLKKVYIESYENFLKGLTQEELKKYSEWKKTAKLSNPDTDASADESSSDSDDDCSVDSHSNIEDKSGIKREAADDDSSSSD